MQNALAQRPESPVATPTADEPVVTTVRPGYARGIPVPWWGKMALKILLAHMPIPYRLWAKIGIFRHGDLSRKLPNLQSSFAEQWAAYQAVFPEPPAACLELGPGDSVGHALMAAQAGAGGMWLVDVGDYATKDPKHYQDFSNLIGFNLAGGNFNREHVLAKTNSRYLTDGIRSLAQIPDHTLDFSFSNAVLEHVHRADFTTLMQALYRLHRPGTVSRHWVDLHDHLGGALNSWRFSPKFWESGLIYRSGFYTNRLTMQEMAATARQAGFNVTINRILKWETTPTPRQALHACFGGKTADEINVCTFLMTLRKP